MTPPPLAESLHQERLPATVATPNGAASPTQPIYANDIHILGYEPLIAPNLLLHELPVPEASKATIAKARAEASAIIHGRDDRLIVVVGPCSLHDVEAAKEYAALLKAKVAGWSGLSIIMRAYFEKPRTTVGWKGLINDPDLDGSFNINRGLRIARSLLIDLTAMGLPVACEVLDTISPQYTSDLYSWGAIGARTTESQLHRELVSGLSMPVGFKNGTDGGLGVALDAIRASSQPHAFMGVTGQGLAAIVKTSGNNDLHVVHRGGSKGPNYDAASIAESRAAWEKSIKDKPACIMVDTSHGNSQKDYKKQRLGIESVCEQLRNGEDAIRGVMMESNINEGKQPEPKPENGGVAALKHGVSVTDACVGWEETVELLDALNAAVLERRKVSAK